jgi:hypothetical protein
MNTNGFKIGDVVEIEPFGDCPTHRCHIEYFKETGGAIFAMGDWFSDEPKPRGNCVQDTGFDVRYIRMAENEKSRSN